MLSTTYGFKMSDKEVIEACTNSKGETIFNCSFVLQKALIIRNGEFIISDVGGQEWSFKKFEQACFFAVASDGCKFGNEYKAVERALKAFPD